MEDQKVTENAATEVAVLKTLAEVEKEHIMAALTTLKNNKSKTATALGITLKTLYNKLHSYGVMEKNGSKKS